MSRERSRKGSDREVTRSQVRHLVSFVSVPGGRNKIGRRGRGIEKTRVSCEKRVWFQMGSDRDAPWNSDWMRGGGLGAGGDDGRDAADGGASPEDAVVEVPTDETDLATMRYGLNQMERYVGWMGIRRTRVSLALFLQILHDLIE
jgi:hypothetical protein